jgi:hypothetical protein
MTHSSHSFQRSGMPTWWASVETAGAPIAGNAIERMSIGARYWIEGSSPRPTGCTRYRGLRRRDDHPVWIVIPDDPRSSRFSFSIHFLRAAKIARELRHPYVLRTHEVGVLDDQRPYVVVDRMPSESLATHVARAGALDWREALPIALRLASAVQAARERGIAPRELDLGACLRVRDGIDPSDVRLGELFVPSAARPEEWDAPALAMMLRGLLGGRPSADVERTLRRDGSVAELVEALAAKEYDGVRESHGANHAAVAGAFEIDVEAEEAIDALRPIPRSAE